MFSGKTIITLYLQRQNHNNIRYFHQHKSHQNTLITSLIGMIIPIIPHINESSELELEFCNTFCEIIQVKKTSTIAF